MLEVLSVITENDKRKDKFFPMTYEEFNNCVCFALRNGDRNVTYKKIKDGLHIGGMADTFEDALYWCKKFYEEDNSVDLCIGDFTGAPTIWSTMDILHKLNVISDEEYDKYIDTLDFDD